MDQPKPQPFMRGPLDRIHRDLGAEVFTVGALFCHV